MRSFERYASRSLLLLAVTAGLLASAVSARSTYHRGSSILGSYSSPRWGMSIGRRIGSRRTSCTRSSSCLDAMKILRAGAEVDSEEDESSDDDEEVVEAQVELIEEEYEEEDEEYDEDEDIMDPEVEEAELSTSVDEFDEPLALPAGLQMGALFSVMILSRRADMFSPKVVRLGRFLFIMYMVLYQAFLVYVRIMAKLNNDRTPVTMTNPLSGIVNAQLGQKEGGDMVKNLASQFLSSTSTVLEYDLRQVKSMNSSLLFNMLFMWFLHFKMGQTQPLFAQTLTGTLNLAFHPIFQVYVLGRNLERPFKTKRGLPGMAEGESGDIDTDEATAEADDEEDEDEEEVDDDESDSDDDSSTDDDEDTDE